MKKIKLFWDRVNEWREHGLDKGLRKGQLYWIVLHSIDKDFANRIQVVETCDPFYVDERIPKFFEVIHREWNII